MTLLQKHSYLLYYQWIGDKVIQWYDKKPDSKDLKNCVKAMKNIGVYNHNLEMELEINSIKLSRLRQDKNRAIERARKAEEQLKILENKINKLEQKV